MKNMFRMMIDICIFEFFPNFLGFLWLEMVENQEQYKNNHEKPLKNIEKTTQIQFFL